jgi:hypothetical protein
METNEMSEPANTELAKFHALLDRTNKEKPDRKDVKALRALLQRNPGIWREVGSLAVQNRLKLVKDVHITTAAAELIHASMETMAQELGYDNASILEQMLIDQLLLAWLRLNLWEYQLTEMETQGMTLTKADFWERRISAAQRRFLRACETLARVRRLARNLPALQVNINAPNGQQVNIAGDYTKSVEDEQAGP